MRHNRLSKHHLVKILMPKCTFDTPTRLGRFTIVRASYAKNGNIVSSIGQARKSDSDLENEQIALGRAKSRAVEAIIDKLNGKEPRHLLAG